MVQELEALDHLWSRAQDQRGSTEVVTRVAGGNSAVEVVFGDWSPVIEFMKICIN